MKELIEHDPTACWYCQQIIGAFTSANQRKHDELTKDLPDSSILPSDWLTEYNQMEKKRLGINYLIKGPIISPDWMIEYGTMEITRLVKDKMSSLTAMTHINELCKQGYIIDNQTVFAELRKVEQLNLKLTLYYYSNYSLNHEEKKAKILYDILIELKESIRKVQDIIDKYVIFSKSRKFSLNINNPKTSTSLPLFHSEAPPQNHTHR